MGALMKELAVTDVQRQQAGKADNLGVREQSALPKGKNF